MHNRTSVLLMGVVILAAATGCYQPKNTTPIPVPKGALIEIYQITPTQTANTKPAIDPANGTPIYLVTPPVVATNDIETIAVQETDLPDSPGLALKLKPSGSRKMVAATTTAGVTQLAFVVNGSVVSVPKVRAMIGDGMVITGSANDPQFANAMKIFGK